MDLAEFREKFPEDEKGEHWTGLLTDDPDVQLIDCDPVEVEADSASEALAKLIADYDCEADEVERWERTPWGWRFETENIADPFHVLQALITKV